MACTSCSLDNIINFIINKYKINRESATSTFYKLRNAVKNKLICGNTFCNILILKSFIKNNRFYKFFNNLSDCYLELLVHYIKETCEDVSCNDCSIDVTGLELFNDVLYVKYAIQTDCEDGCLCTEVWLHDPNIEDIINADFISVTVDGTTYTAPTPIPYTQESDIRAFLFGLNLPVNWIVNWYYDSAPDDWTYIFGVSCQSHVIEIEMAGGTFTLNSFQNVAIPALYSIYQYYNFEWIGDPYTFVCYNNACDGGFDTITVGLSITSNGDTIELDCQQSSGIYDVKENSTFINEDGMVAVIGASNNGCVSFCDTASFITIVDSGVINRSGDNTILSAPVSTPICSGTIGFVELLADGVIGVALSAATGSISIPAQILGVNSSYYYYVTCDGLVVATIRYILTN